MADAKALQFGAVLLENLHDMPAPVQVETEAEVEVRAMPAELEEIVENESFLAPQ